MVYALKVLSIVISEVILKHQIQLYILILGEEFMVS